MNMFKGWRTLAFNLVAALPILWEVVFQVIQTPEIAQIIPPAWSPYYVLALTVGNIILRVITSTPVGRGQ